MISLPFASNFLENMSLWPTGGFVSSVHTSPNTLCFLREAYLVSSALLQSGHFCDALISAKVSGSGATSVVNVVRWNLVCLDIDGVCLLVGWLSLVGGYMFLVGGFGVVEVPNRSRMGFGLPGL